MKRSIVGVLVAVVAILAVNVAVAQSPTKVNVPFNFIVGQKAFPAGSYELENVAERATLIASADGTVETDCPVVPLRVARDAEPEAGLRQDW